MRYGFFLLLLALVVLPSYAFAVAPTVDFSFTPTNPIFNQAITFDPEVTTDSNLQLFLWQFDVDGNTNYPGEFSTFPLTSYYDQDFNNGSPGWLFNGVWSTANDYLETSTGDVNAQIDLPDQSLLDANYVFSWSQYIAASTNNGRTFFVSDSVSSSLANGYLIEFRNVETKILLRRIDAGSLTTILDLGAITTGQFVDVNVIVRDGNFEVILDGISSGSVIDNNYKDVNFLVLFNGDADAESRWDNIEFSIIDPIDFDKNETHTFTTVGTKTVCLTAKNVTGITTACNDLNVSGTLKMTFFDENTGLQFAPSSVTVNGVAQALDGNVLNFSLADTNNDTDFTVLASDANKTEREWFFKDLNKLDSVDLNVFLLDSNLGRTIDFKIFHPNKTLTLNNAIISLLRAGDQNYSSIKQTSGTGNITFFVNDDANYVLDIDANSNGTSDFNYVPLILTVLVPKDESNGVAITPFRIQVSGLASADLNGLTTSTTIPLFSNTIDFYKLTISKPIGSDYTFPRQYLLRTRGNPETDTLQPYLGSDASGTFNSSFQTLDRFTRIPLAGIIIRTQGTTTDGTKETESRLTDSSGRGLFSLILNNDYNLLFFLSTVDENFIGSSFINAQSSTYFFLLDLTQFDSNLGISTGLDINYLQSFIQTDVNNNFDLNWTLTQGDLSTTQIVWQVYDNAGLTLVNRTFTDGFGSLIIRDGNTLNYVRQDVNTLITSSILVTFNGADINFVKVFNVYTSNERPLQQSFEELEGILGKFATTFIALFFAILIHGFVAVRTPGSSTNGLFLLVAAVVGGFILMGWVDSFNFAFAAFFSLGAWLFVDRSSG